MNGFPEFADHDLRLVLLRLLREGGGAANESVLHSAALAYGHVRATRQKIRDELAWLGERGLIVPEWIADKVLVAKLTERGLDVASGREHVEGVKRPSIVG